ncbi:MAG: YkgJ family cysteine cluster protein [Usitatibacter sp.]
MKNGKPFPIPVRVVKKTLKYSCEKCPGYCCSYTEIEITMRDVERLARHFGIKPAEAQERFTKTSAKGVMMLRHRKDTIFDSTCTLFDQDKRRCTVYEARPGVCRKYPDSVRCGYYDFLTFEREQQGDEELVALT